MPLFLQEVMFQTTQRKHTWPTPAKRRQQITRVPPGGCTRPTHKRGTKQQRVETENPGMGFRGATTGKWVLFELTVHSHPYLRNPCTCSSKGRKLLDREGSPNAGTGYEEIGFVHALCTRKYGHVPSGATNCNFPVGFQNKIIYNSPPTPPPHKKKVTPSHGLLPALQEHNETVPCFSSEHSVHLPGRSSFSLLFNHGESMLKPPVS